MPTCANCCNFTIPPNWQMEGFCRAQPIGEMNYKVVGFYDDVSACSHFKPLDYVETDSREFGNDPNVRRYTGDFDHTEVDVKVKPQDTPQEKGWG